MDEQRYRVTRRSNRNGTESSAGRNLSLIAAADLAFRLEQLQWENSTGSDEFIVEVD